MSKNKQKYIQHGDVSFHPISELPGGLKKIKHDGVFIITIGELQGHAHRVITKEKENYDIYQDEKGKYYISIQGKTEIEHWNTITQLPAEHKTLPFEIGIYEQDFEEDYNPITEELSKTRD